MAEARTIVSVQQIQTSTESGGINIIRFTYSDGTYYDAQIRNGGPGEAGQDGERGYRGPAGVESVEIPAFQNTGGSPSADVTLQDGVLRLYFKNMKGEQGAPGVSRIYYKKVASLPASASSETLDTIFLVEDSQAPGTYEMWYTEKDGDTYSFVSLGTTELDLDDYVTFDDLNEVTCLTDADYFNDLVADIVLKEGVDDPESENYVDFSDFTRMALSCCHFDSENNIYINRIRIYYGGGVYINLFNKTYDGLSDAKADLGVLLESNKCYVVLRDIGSSTKSVYGSLTFNRDVTWKSLNEHPVIKELLIAGSVYTKDETYNKEEVDSKIDEKIADAVGEYVDAPDLLRAITDNENKLLFGIKKDGDIVFGGGVPSQIRRYVEEYAEHEDEQMPFVPTAFTFQLNHAINATAALPQRNPVYESYTATEQTSDIATLLPSEGDINVYYKIYDWDGTAYDNTKYAVYEWVFDKIEGGAANYKYRLLHVSDKESAPSAQSQSPFVINVDDQTDFDSLPAALSSAIESYTDIVVLIKAGTYIYSDTIRLSGNHENVSVSIIGEDGVVLIPRHESYTIGDQDAEIEGDRVSIPIKRTEHSISGDDTSPLVPVFNYDDIMLDSNNNLIDIIDENRFKFMTELVSLETPGEYVAGDDVICVIHNTGYPDTLAAECTNLYVRVTYQYQMGTYKVRNIADGNIYFEWTYSKYRGALEINADYTFSGGGVMPRYKLINYDNGGNVYVDGDTNIHFPLSLKEVKILRSLSWLSLSSYTVTENDESVEKDSRFKNVSIQGIVFNGSSALAPIWIGDNFTDYISIRNCKFMNTKTNGILMTRLSNIEISHNLFSKSYGQFVYCYGGIGSRIYIHDNAFYDGGRYCVKVSRCSNVMIKNNYLENYGYDGISVNGTVAKPFIGIVEGNIITCTPDYYSNIMEHCLMDSGAIYVHNFTGDAIVRWNVILRHRGMYADNGIFCDNGSSNFSLLGNVVLDSNNRTSIRSWLRSDLYPEGHNTYNCMFYNIVNAPIQFNGKRVSDNYCVKGPQIFLGKIDGNDYTNINAEDDFIVNKYELRNDTVYAAVDVVNSLRAVLEDNIKYRLDYLYRK